MAIMRLLVTAMHIELEPLTSREMVEGRSHVDTPHGAG